MNHKQDSNFVWTDVSTFDVEEADRFYSQVFGWNYKSEGEYNYAHKGGKPASGMFLMPEFLQKINMPSFWMSYLSVNEIEKVVEAAKKIKNVVIEIEPFEFSGGKAALIRDPSGAGFTVYEGPDINSKSSSGAYGRMVWNELIISDVKLVKSFYEKVFGLKIEADKDSQTERYKVMNPAGKEIAGITIMSEDLKGDKQFWLPYFAIDEMSKFAKTVEANGGTEAYIEDTGYGKTGLFYDTQDAAFGVAETGVSNYNFKPKTLIGLAIIFTAILTDTNWIWGVFFLYWLSLDIASGSTYVAESIQRKTNPILYWIIITVWFVTAVYFLFS